MSKLEIILICVSIISILINLGVFAYARSAITQLLSVSEELGDLKTMVDSFAAHSKEVYEMEMFYGDETLQSLMDHAKSFTEQLETFEYIYSLTEEDINDGTEPEPTEEKEN